jgi:hypothetical protein
MSLGIYPVLNPRIPEATYQATGEALVSEVEVLDRRADVLVGGTIRVGDAIIVEEGP